MSTAAPDERPLLEDQPSTDHQDDDAQERPRTNGPKVVDSLPFAAWSVILVEFCERFAYFGISGPLQNYMQLPSDDPTRPHGLGMTQQAATTLKLAFVFWCYLTPIFSGIVADQYLGRLRTILYAAWLYGAGLVVLAWSSTAAASGTGLPRVSLVVALVLLGLGTGGIKTNANTLLAEQYRPPPHGERMLSTGKVVEIDVAATIQRIFMIFFVLVNVGSMSALVTTYIESSSSGGFTAAFLLPLVVFILGILALVATKHYYTVAPPTGSILLNAAKVLLIAASNGFSVAAAQPGRHPNGTARAVFNFRLRVTYTDDFPSQVQAALRACSTFAFFPFYWAAYAQMLSNFVSQAATMETHGLPNDSLVNIDPLVIVLLVPFLDLVLYPYLRRYAPRLVPGPLVRILVGFFLCSLGMAWAALVQSLIYKAPPCFDYPLTQECPHPNSVHIAIQVPAYVLVAVSEVLVSVTGLEYAFVQAPPSMKSLVMAMYLSTSAGGAVIASAFAPLTVHPKLTWLYGGMSLMVGVAGAAFGLLRVARWNMK